MNKDTHVTVIERYEQMENTEKAIQLLIHLPDNLKNAHLEKLYKKMLVLLKSAEFTNSSRPMCTGCIEWINNAIQFTQYKLDQL